MRDFLELALQRLQIQVTVHIYSQLVTLSFVHNPSIHLPLDNVVYIVCHIFNTLNNNTLILIMALITHIIINNNVLCPIKK